MFTLTDPDHPEPISCLAWSPCGDALVSGNRAGWLTFWDLAARRKRLTLRLPGACEGVWAHQVAAVDYSPDGDRLAVVTGTFPPYVRVYQSATGTLLHQFEGGCAANAVVFLPDGNTIVGAGGTGHGPNDDNYPLYQWDLAAARRRKVLVGHTGEIVTLARSPDGKRLASGAVDRTVRLWDPNIAVALQVLKVRNWVREAAFAPTGTVLAVATEESVRLWEVATGHPLRRLRGHGKSVGSIAFHPSGRWLVSGSDDGTVRLWDVSISKEHDACPGGFDWRIGTVYAVRFSPDGLTAAAGGENGSIVIWDVDVE
jgi:WD40 repeat protein